MKSGVVVLLLLILSFDPADLTAQTRERRVGSTTSAPATQPTTSPGQTAPAPTSAAAREEVAEGDVVSINTTLVTVPVSVTDRSGRYIADLSKDEFRIFENGIEQSIAYFATVEKPFTVVLVLDTSSSIWSKLGQIRD